MVNQKTINGVIAVGVLAIAAVVVGGAIFDVGPLSAADGDNGEMTDIRDATPNLVFHFSDQVTADVQVAGEEMEDFGNYVAYDGSTVDADRTTSVSGSDTATFEGWTDAGTHYVAVEADGYHTAFWTPDIDSQVGEERKDNYRLYGFYDGEAELEEEASITSGSAALYDSDDEQVGFESSSDTVTVDSNTDRVEANFEIDSGVAYLGEVDVTASEETDISVVVDGSTVVDDTFSEGDTIELADNMEESPLKAEDEVQIVFDDLGGSTTDEAVTVNDIYGNEAVSTSLNTPA